MALFDEGATWRRKLACLVEEKMSARCFLCLLFFGVLFSVAGVIMTGTTYNSQPRPFQQRTAAKQKEIEVIKIVGPVLLSLGLTASVVSIVLRFRLSLWQLCKRVTGKCAKKPDGNVILESVFSNEFQLRERGTSDDDVRPSDSPSTLHSVDSKQLADNIMY